MHFLCEDYAQNLTNYDAYLRCVNLMQCIDKQTLFNSNQSIMQHVLTPECKENTQPSADNFMKFL